ncbi:hypothetical protein GDO86_001555 [Hymenochirus boettgeri]|uniref:Homeobox domain-containing protein n=1 Tax=Hymenochirus boettgeri TaxID=247094 RepID=A0A8T2KIT4_9PIPI|nr:hypothetical protein GDO86_001555 [Hymenochirus boettgeri]
MSPTTTKDPLMCSDSSTGLVCLPPISDDLELIWTEAELTELDDHPQLVHTFSYFPYPSMPEIALLCLRYGLQMEKVKIWFMAQRIRCGISWSSEEIEETRSRLLYNQDQLHFKPLVAFAKKSSKFQSTEKCKVSTPNFEASREITTPPLCSSLDNEGPEAKRIKTDFLTPDTETGLVADFIPDNGKQSPNKSCDSFYSFGKQSPDTGCIRETQQELRHSTKVPGQMFSVDGTNVSSAVPCLPSEEELCRTWGTPSQNAEILLKFQDHSFQESGEGVLREDSYTPVMRRQRKSKEQLAILKSFFLKCQWASREDYQKLEEITGLPRADIIQWFGDTRYALKHGQLKWFRENAPGRPAWLDEPQHLVSQNGKIGESKVGGSPSVTPVLGMPGADIKSIIPPVRNSGTLDMTTPATFVVQRSVVKDAPKSNQSSLMEKDTIHSLGDSTGTVVQTIKKHSSALPTVSQSGHTVNYNVLEGYWSTHHNIQEADLQSLVRDSGLGQKEVLDWFCKKSNEPAGVVICLDEDDGDIEVIEAEEEDDVVIQD